VAPASLLWLIRHFPAGAMDGLRRTALRRTVRLAGRRSRFYRDKFAALHIDPERVRDLADLRDCETTPEECRAAPPDALLCGRPDLVVESSGTSGRVTRLYLSHAELEYYARQGVILLAMMGAGPADRILGAFEYAWGLGGIYTQRIGAHSGLFGVFPGLVDPAEAIERLPEYRFTIVMGDPFWIARFTEIAMARGVRAPMTGFVSAAERMTERLRGLIEDYWKAPVYMTYASTELGASLGAECTEKTGYHLHEYDYAVEILNPDADGFGEVAFTTLTRSVMPLIRYRTGDVARLIPGRCPCGLPFRRLSAIRGRNDELLACVWGNVHPGLFEDLLRGVEGIGDEWQVALRQPGLRRCSSSVSNPRPVPPPWRPPRRGFGPISPNSIPPLGQDRAAPVRHQGVSGASRKSPDGAEDPPAGGRAGRMTPMTSGGAEIRWTSGGECHIFDRLNAF